MEALLKDGKVIGQMAQGKSNEWFTPSKYIEAAREVMGGIDLDPASCELANRTVRARRYFTKEDNGLSREWKAEKVYLNPPYGRSQTPGQKTHQGYWIEKLVRHYQQGDIAQAILLTTNRADTSWFRPLWDFPICFTENKVGFYVPSRGKVLQECSHIHGTIFVYLGLYEYRFIEVFSQFGPVVKRVSPPKGQPSMRTLWEVAE